MNDRKIFISDKKPTKLLQLKVGTVLTKEINSNIMDMMERVIKQRDEYIVRQFKAKLLKEIEKMRWETDSRDWTPIIINKTLDDITALIKKGK